MDKFLATKVASATVTAALQVDAAHFDVEYNLYSKKNINLYELAISTWLLMIEDETGYYPDHVEYYIRQHGLISAIAKSVELSSSIIDGNETHPASPFLQLMYDFIALHGESSDCMRRLLILLRFLKRFSPAETKKLEREGIVHLVNINNANKMRARTLGNHHYVIAELRSVMNDLIGRPVRRNDDLIELPTGACAEGCKSLSEKLLVVESEVPNLLCTTTWPGLDQLPFKVAHSESYERDKFGFVTAYHHGSVNWYREWSSVVTSVPKTYKARRIIAKEPVTLQVLQQRLADQLERTWLKCRKLGANHVDIHDQTRNQSLASVGSIEGCVATLDLSAASDSISAALVEAVFPTWFTQQSRVLRSTHFTLPDGKVVCNHIFATMGSRLTFPVETILFYGITLLGTMWWLSYERTGKITDYLWATSAYGDDITCYDEAAPYVISILEILGFDVNIDKSFFGSSKYRESCGEEYWSGLTVSAKYFPRHEFPSSNAGRVQFLVELQHRLVEYRGTNQFLTHIIRQKYPSMTESLTGSIYQDLWTNYPDISVASPPVKRGADFPDVCFRERHVSFTMRESVGGASPRLIDAAERFAYHQFLLYGPLYEDPLMELLHCSTPRVDLEALLATKQASVSIVKILY